MYVAPLSDTIEPIKPALARRYELLPDESLLLTLVPKPLYANVFVVMPGLEIEVTRSS